MSGVGEQHGPSDVRPDTAVGLRSHRGPVLQALMIATGLVALDSTIIATAVLTVVKDLGNFAAFPWLFSAYLLAQAVTVPIYGKLADNFGRKPVMLWGIAVFAAGSALCGLATSTAMLVVFRVIQGVGAGAVQPMAMTIAGDIYTLAERAKAQGYLASVWAVSAVLGPTLGGLLCEYLSWRWIFLINVPLCALAAGLLIRKFQEQGHRPRRRLNIAAALPLSGGAGALMLGLLQGGHAWPWRSATNYIVFGIATTLFALFGIADRRSEDPLLPTWVFTHRILAATSAITFLVGAVLLGLTSYVPTLVQGLLGTGPLVAGLALAPLLIGWTALASLSGRIYLRIGFRRTVLGGSVVACLGGVLTTIFGTQSTIWQVAGVCLLIGSGMGLVAAPALIAAQTSVEWTARGVVTSTNMFARAIGSAVGVAVFGAMITSQTRGLDHPSAVTLAGGLHLVFTAIAMTTGGLVAASLFLPGRR